MTRTLPRKQRETFLSKNYPYQLRDAVLFHVATRVHDIIFFLLSRASHNLGRETTYFQGEGSA